MLIPKCCKGCSNRKSGMCCCSLPIYNNEWVEDDETYPTNTSGTIGTTNPYNIYNNDMEKENKDHIIRVLKKALELACQENVENMCVANNIKKPEEYFINQAKKELDDK